MTRSPFMWLVVCVCAVGVAMPSVARADYWDCFNDGYYDRSDPNMPGYDANDPYYTDPNNAVLWDVDNPDWEILNLIVGPYLASAQPGLLRLWGDWGILPYVFVGAVCDDGNHDANTSLTYFDNSGPHYMVGYIVVHNPRTGMTGLWFHNNWTYWTSYATQYEPLDGWSSISSYYGTVFDDAVSTSRLFYPFDPNLCDPNITDPNTPEFIDANYPDDYPNPKGYPTPPGYPYLPDAASFWNWWYTHNPGGDPNGVDVVTFDYHPDAPDPNGFWMVMQFDPNGVNIDPNNPSYEPNDPNCHWIRMSYYNGAKFDWDGTWVLQANVMNGSWWNGPPPEYPLYWTEGTCAVSSFAGGDSNAPSDVAYDNLEFRWGYFTNESYALSLTVKKSQMGSVSIDPDLLDMINLDPNDFTIPLDPNYPRRYTSGTEVMLAAEAIPGKSFKQWKIYDPNHPGDSNYATIDTNSVTYITMDGDYVVEASFKCGSSEVMPLAMVLMALGLGLVIRRLR